MPRLAAIEVQGFRAFANWTRLELRPLTLLYGRNNAGKSSLLRLLAMLADSVGETARSALETHGPAARGARFKDLPWTGDGKPRSAFKLRLCWDGPTPCTDEFELVWLDERSRAMVRRWWLRDAAGVTQWSLEAEAYPDDEMYRPSGSAEPMRVSWSGLLPQGDHPQLCSLRERLTTLRRGVLWLDSNRPRPKRTVQSQQSAPPALEHDGANACEFLSADAKLLSAVRTWFAAPPIERDLRLKPIGDGFVSPILGSKHSIAEFHLLDAGEGMAHVLPVLVGASIVARGSGFRVFEVEEPESHLHGDTQRALIHHLATLAAAEDPPIILLETHSRALLLGLQLAVAEGVLPCERSSVVWCEQDGNGVSSLCNVEVLADGGLRGWPASALANENQMVRELLDKQDERFATGN